MSNNAEKIKSIAKDIYRSLGSGYSEEVSAYYSQDGTLLYFTTALSTM
jgi:hypothetical protein